MAATATIIQEGRFQDHTPAADVAAGDVVVVGGRVYVAPEAISADVLGAVMARGVARFPKDTGSGTAIAGGTLVYWDAGNEVITTTAGANTQAGYTVPDGASDDDDTVDVELQPA